MSKLNCEIIKDLIPLYLDKICSAQTEKAVEDHLADCPICEAELLKLKNTPNLEPDFDKETDKAVKNARKYIKMGKKRAVIKTIYVTLAILLVVGVSLYLYIPIKIARNEFSNLGYHKAICDAITLEISNRKLPNYQGEHASVCIDEKHGKYTVKKHEISEVLSFEDGKQITIITAEAAQENYAPIFENGKIFGFDGTASYPFFMPLVKKGIEYMGIDSKTAPYDNKIYLKLITADDYFIFTKAKTFKEYAIRYAYYALYSSVMPLGEFYITAYGENLNGYGFCRLTEKDGAIYNITIQNNDDTTTETTIILNGFSREDFIEIIDSVNLKGGNNK